MEECKHVYLLLCYDQVGDFSYIYGIYSSYEGARNARNKEIDKHEYMAQYLEIEEEILHED